MKRSYDTLLLSPHLDDAILSCGGLIYEQTQRSESVLIVTLAAGEPQTDVRSVFAQFLHHNWGLSASEAVAVRRAEDLEACRRVGADALHGSLPDCIYRLHPQEGQPLYSSNEAIFGAVHPAEQPLVTELAQFMATLPAAQRVLAPLTVGNHVDHQLVRAAAEQVWGDELTYYEDYPYVQHAPEALAALVQPPAAWRAGITPIGAAALAARIAATAAYRSQISTLFNSVEQMAEAIKAQVGATGGERFWRRAPQAE